MEQSVHAVCVRGKLLLFRDPKSRYPTHAVTLGCTEIDRHPEHDEEFIIDCGVHTDMHQVRWILLFFLFV